MMQVLGVMPEVIDRRQNHVLAGPRLRRHDLKHDDAGESKQGWANGGPPLSPSGSEDTGHRLGHVYR